MPNHRLATKTQGKGTHMRKNNRTYSPSLNTLLVSVAVATIPGVGYAEFSGYCTFVNNYYSTLLDYRSTYSTYSSRWNSLCSTYSSDSGSCQESLEGGVGGDLWSECIYYGKTLNQCKSATSNSNLQTCWASSGTTYTCPSFKKKPSLTRPTTSVTSLSSCYVPYGNSFTDSTGHTLQFVSNCYYPNYNAS